MTLSEMIQQARVLSDDLVEPHLVSRTKYVVWANQAEREACRRSRALLDSTTTAICQIALVNGTPTYALDARILFVRRVKLTDVSVPLGRVSRKTLDEGRPGWEDETGQPTHYVPDMGTGLLRPYPTPDASYTANLVVVRLPLADMEDGDDEPELPARSHDGLVDWMLHRAYSMPDSEIYSPKKSAEHEARFIAEFGKRSSAQDEIWIEREHGYEQDEGIY